MERTVDNRSLMVTIQCLAYNQEPYIRQCLDGFVMQKTDFRFEAIVHDDASTDDTAKIIREYAEKYPDIIKPIIETENQYSKRDGSLRRIMDEHTHGKYVAVCEGDDYWIDERKLQMQYDFLNTHPDYTMVFNAINCLYPDGTIKEEHRYSNDNLECDIRDCIKAGGGYAKVAAMMYVRGMEDYSEWASKSTVGDLPSQLTLFTKGKVMYIDKIVSCYRINSIGSWSKSNTTKFKARYAHNKKITKVWRAFDQYTDNKFHNEIKRKIANNFINLLPFPFKVVAKMLLKSYLV